MLENGSKNKSKRCAVEPGRKASASFTYTQFCSFFEFVRVLWVTAVAVFLCELHTWANGK